MGWICPLKWATRRERVMTIKPRFMPTEPGGNSWEPSGVRGAPIATALTFSSKSPFRYDDWIRDVSRPYLIVAMPGYKPLPMTSALRNDADYMWFDRPVSRPTIVWDGWCPTALFEVIAEGFRDGHDAPTMRVRDGRNKRWVADARSSHLLAARPARSSSMPDAVSDCYGYALASREHRRALLRWAQDCRQREKGGIAAVDAWERTVQMYRAVLNPRDEWHVDSLERKQRAFARWDADHIRPIVEGSDYRSPVQFMEAGIDRRARDAFRAQAGRMQAEAVGRNERAAAQLQIEAPKATIWGRLFKAS